MTQDAKALEHLTPVGHRVDPALESALIREMAESLALAIARVDEVVRTLDVVLNVPRAVDRDLALNRARDFARDVGRRLAEARELSLSSDHLHLRALIRALGAAHHLAGRLNFALDLEFARTPKVNRARDVARDLALDLSDDLATAASSAEAIHQMTGSVHLYAAASSEVIRDDLARENAPAPRLINFTVRLLPSEHRIRYQDEFRAELHDLAQAKAAQWHLLLYAVRQLRRVWQLRAALQAPDQPRFYRLHGTARWILASEWRTWGLLGPPMLLAIVNVFMAQGWGSAFYTLPSLAAFYAGVDWLRKRLGLEMKRDGRSRDHRLE